MRTLTTPRDHNPYQRLLHEALGQEGVEPEFLAMPTTSRTVNILLIPLTLLRARAGGVRILHIHWVFGLTFAGSGSSELLRRLSQMWFAAILNWCHVLSIRVVWTAHNILPHDRVFHDDQAARARLVRASSHVILHDARVGTQIAALVGDGVALPPMTVVPHGSFVDARAGQATNRREARLRLGLPQEARIVLFFGRVTADKGAGDLTAAFDALPGDGPHVPLLVIAGRCTDPVLLRQLQTAADELDGRLVLDLRQLPDDDLHAYLAAADVIAMPFRNVTTSGSALMAMASGRPVVVPNLPQLASLPDEACSRYDPRSPSGLVGALAAVCSAPGEVLERAGEAGRAWTAEAPGWPVAARRTAQVYRQVLDPRGSL